MTYCCDNVKKAYDLILRARGSLDWSENFGGGDYFVGFLTLGISSNISQSESIDEAQRRMRRARSDLGDAQDLINSCSCGNYAELNRRFNELNSKYSDLSREIERNKGETRNLESQRTREQINNTQTITKLERDLIASDNKNSDLTRRLTDNENKVGRLEELRSENIIKVGRLEIKEEEIKELKKGLELAKRDTWDERLNFKEYKLEIFVNRLDIGLRKVRNLRRNYKELITIRERNGGVNIDNVAESNVLENITLIQESLQEEDVVSIINVQKLCRKCEKLARLELEIEKFQQQQYQAQQEVPTNH